MFKVCKDVCIGCGACAGNCPVGAADVTDGVAQISDDCIGCGVCVDNCPVEAISEG